MTAFGKLATSFLSAVFAGFTAEVLHQLGRIGPWWPIPAAIVAACLVFAMLNRGDL